MRCGKILVAPEMMAEILHAPEDSMYSLANAPHDTIHAALLLPASYRVVGIDLDRVSLHNYYSIHLEGEHLPDVPDGSDIPSVYPIYTRHYQAGETYVTQLTRMTVDSKELPLT